jgi:hypothetical protein
MKQQPKPSRKTVNLHVAHELKLADPAQQPVEPGW